MIILILLHLIDPHRRSTQGTTDREGSAPSHHAQHAALGRSGDKSRRGRGRSHRVPGEVLQWRSWCGRDGRKGCGRWRSGGSRDRSEAADTSSWSAETGIGFSIHVCRQGEKKKGKKMAPLRDDQKKWRQIRKPTDARHLCCCSACARQGSQSPLHNCSSRCYQWHRYRH